MSSGELLAYNNCNTPAILLFMPLPYVNSASTSSLGLSSFHERYRILDEKHQWLLKQIKRKRTELKNFLDHMDSIAREIAQQADPLIKQLVFLDREIHQLFKEILTKKWGLKTHNKTLEIYHYLQLTGVISPGFIHDKKHSNSKSESMKDQDESQHYSGSNSEDTRDSDSEDSVLSRQVRQTFLKLASVFHPDKVSDKEVQTHYTEIMKELNRAYQEGDIARLLEIEKQHHLQENIELNPTNQSEMERLCLQRERDNQLLFEQYEGLKSQLRKARNSPEGAMVKHYRACQKEGINVVAGMISEMESEIQHLETICNFVRDFRDKKITLAQFIKGRINRKEFSEQEKLDVVLNHFT